MLGSHRPPDAETGRQDPPPEPSEGAWLCQRLGFRLPASRRREDASAVSSRRFGTVLCDGGLGMPVRDLSPGGHVPA